MKNKTQHVEFTPKSDYAEMLVPKPKPAINYLPEWYRKTTMFETPKPMINKMGGANTTVRSCMSFADSFTMGYIQETWCDLLVHAEGNKCFIIESMSNPQTVTQNEDISFNIPQDYYQSDVSWQLQWIPKLPDGYSMMYVHPFNRWDLPFETVTGIVDNDKFFFENVGNYPFMIKKSFKGIIPKGTPFIQMIPFKRDDWQSSYNSHDPKQQILASVVNSKFWGGYKKLFWNRKVFR